MKKRWIASLLAMCMLLTLLPLQALADGYGIPGSICDLQGHSWERTGSSDPNCTSDGYVYYRCRYCGETKREETRPAWGHNWGEWTVIKEPTCLEKGAREHTCLRCGKTEKKSLPKADHVWGDWNVLAEPQDVPGVQEPGVRERACGVCGRTEKERFYPYGTQLRKGEHDPAAVMAFQTGLNAAGYKLGDADGVFDRTTENAVKSFQRANGCKQDGIFWPCMWQLLGVTPPGGDGGEGGGPDDGGDAKVSPAKAEPGQPEITVTEHSKPLDGKAYGYGENVLYEIIVTNPTPADFTDMNLYNSQSDTPYGNLAMGYAVPQSSLPLVFYASHFVTKADVDAGSIKAETWADLIDPAGEPVTVHGDEVTVDTKGFTLPTLSVKEISKPQVGDAYGYGEIIQYEITFDNDTQWPWDELAVFNSQHDPDGKVAWPMPVGPGKMYFHAQHTVNAADLGYTELTASTWATLKSPAGDPFTLDAKDVTVKIKRIDAPKISVTEVSKPLDGDAYGYGEIVDYKITVENPTQWPVPDADVFNSANDAGPLVVADLYLSPGSGEMVHFAHHFVDVGDVDAGEIAATTWMNCVDASGQQHTLEADTVTVKTKGFAFPSVTVKEVSKPWEGDAYGFGEIVDYEITIDNPTQWACYSGDLFNSANDYDMQAAAGVFLAPYVTGLKYYAHHTVTLSDVLGGEIVAHTWLNFQDAAWRPQSVNGNDVTVKTKEFVLPTLEAALVTPEPAEGFMLNDVIVVELRIKNPTQWPYTDMDLYTDLCDLPLHRVVQGAYVSNWSENPFTASYLVTPADVAAGKIVAESWMDFKDVAGREYTVFAEDLTVNIRPFDPPVVKITEASTPLDGEYALNETILFDVEIENATPWMFTGVEEYNGLLPPPTFQYGTIPVLGAYNTMGYIVSHVVTYADTVAGSVTDTAWIYALDPASILHVVHAEDLTVKVKKAVTDTVPVPPLGAEPHAGDHCVRTMTAHADGLPVWEIAPCAEHGALLADTYVRIEAAGDDPQALYAAAGESVNLWYEAIDALYAEWIETDPASESVILADRGAFYADAAALMQAVTLTRPVTDRAAIETMIELMADKCATLCYEIHAAPGARLDTVRAGLEAIPRDPSDECGVRYAYDGSVFTQTAHACGEHAQIAALTAKLLLAAGGGEREALLHRIGLVWKAELDARLGALSEGAPVSLAETVRGVTASFARLLEAREAALTALWPDDPAAVKELLAQQVMLRVLRLCALERELG